MKNACHREQFNKGYVLIFSKEPPSCHLPEMALYSRSTTSAKAMFVVVVVTIFSWYFMNVVVFFSVLTFGLPGKTSVMHHLLTVIKKTLT